MRAFLTPRFSLYFILIGLLLTVLACGAKTPLDAAHADYAGKWVAADGTYVQFFLDGSGNFEGSGSRIQGGAAQFEGETVSIGIGPIEKTFHIDQPPTESGAGMTIILDGVTYHRE